MRPSITADNAKNLSSDALRTIFEGIALAKHYKALYLLQKDKNISYLAGLKLFFDNKEYLSDVDTFLKNDENYKLVFKSSIINYEDEFEANYDIPTRNADFKVEDDDMISWFYIEERTEIHYSGSCFYIYKLIADPKTNILLRSRGGAEWEECDELSPVGVAYKGYIAERELLSDN